MCCYLLNSKVSENSCEEDQLPQIENGFFYEERPYYANGGKKVVYVCNLGYYQILSHNILSDSAKVSCHNERWEDSACITRFVITPLYHTIITPLSQNYYVIIMSLSLIFSQRSNGIFAK